MAKEMTEAQMVGLVRNALLVAGYEMGQTGDHWPVINDTILNIAKDWEEWRTQKDVKAEMRVYLYEQLEIMEKGLMNCSQPLQVELTPVLRELRELYDAYLSPLDEGVTSPIHEDEVPFYVKRAEAILETLGGNHV